MLSSLLLLFLSPSPPTLKNPNLRCEDLEKMPPRAKRKVAKKSARKTPSPKPPAPQTPTALPEPAAPVSNEKENDAQQTPIIEIDNNETVPEKGEPENPAAPIVIDEPPAAPVVPEPPAAADVVVAEQSELTPEASAAEPEVGVPETETAVAETSTTGAVATENAAKGKRTVKVRKVIKKVIVKKVPKVVKKVQEAVAVECAVGGGVEDRDPNSSTEPNANSVNDPGTVTAAAASVLSGEARTEQEVAMETEKVNEAEVGDVEENVVENKDSGEIAGTVGTSVADEQAAISERQQRRKTEIFIGGLDRDAKEEDIRKVFGKIGEIVEVRMMMDVQTGKNKGYAFLRFALPAQAKQAVSEFAKVEICGKICGAAALEGNDTIFLGNIDKKWKKEDLVKLLQEIGIEKIDTVTVMFDPSNVDTNRGFAFLELETNRDAQIAFKKLQKKDAFGKGRNIKVAWATPLIEPDEEDMQKVKSVYAEGLPSSWTEEKVKDCFKKFGEIERVVLSRNIQSAKRKDFAFVNYTTREAALSCVESFDKEELLDSGSKINIRVSLAKPLQKGKQNKGPSKSGNKDIPRERMKTVQNMKVNTTSSKPQAFKGGYGNAAGDRKSSTAQEHLHVLREQATWKQGQMGYARGPAIQDYPYALHGEKRPYSSLGDAPLYPDPRGYPRARLEVPYPAAGPSPLSTGIAGTSLLYYHRPSAGYAPGTHYGAADPSSSIQARYGKAPYGTNRYPRY